MRLGCCGSEDRLDAIKNAGYEYVEPPVPVLRPNLGDADFESVRRQFRNSPIKPEAFNLFVPGNLKITGDSVDFSDLIRHVEIVMNRAQELGGQLIVFGSGGARNVPENFDRNHGFSQLGAFCAMAADQAYQRGLTVVIEPLTAKMCNVITSVAEGAELVRDVNQPGLALLADLYHMESDGEPWINLQNSIHLLHHIHVPVPDINGLTTEGRDFSHSQFFQSLRLAGYDGRITVEDNGKRFENFAAEAVPVRAHLLDLWKKAEG